MSNTVIQVDNLSKRYQLGTIGYGSLHHDLAAWWAKARGKEDPNTRIGEKSRLDLHGEFWALRDVGFEVQQGDRVGIIGRNGAGKSTLLKLLSRVTSPTTGSIKVKGRIASLLEVGTGFHPELTGRENVFLNGAILGMKRREIQAKFDEIVAFAGVEQFIDTPVKRYSSGMYVRLAFSVAAHLDSEILIIDEVLAVGDAEFQKKCIQKMTNLSATMGRTILFVSHQLSTVRNFCNVGILLDHGQIESSGDISTVLQVYQRSGVTTGATDLARRVATGTGAMTILACSALNDRGGAINELFMGDSCTIETEVEVCDANALESAIVTFTLHDPYGTEVVSWVSDELASVCPLKEGRNILRLSVQQLLLRPGQYSLSINARRYPLGVEVIDDRWEQVLEIRVQSSNFWGVDRVIRSGNMCAIPASLTRE